MPQQPAQSAVVGRAWSPISVMFLLHIALEAPFAIQGLFASASLPVLDATNTTLIFVKMYAALATGTCIGAVLVFSLPEYLPGKRAFSINLMIYHTIAAGSLFQAPRFIPVSFGTLAESLKLTPENTWAILHALLGLGFAVWWQATLAYAQAARQLTMGAAAGQGQGPKRR